VEKFDIQTGAWIGTIASGVGDPSGLALTPSQASDLLVGNLTGGGVLRYSSAAQPLADGGVAPGDSGNYFTSGVAVAPDGSYYVSSPQTIIDSEGDSAPEILHYSSSGVFLNVLGANDPNQAPLAYPGTLAFGPDGNLYVADLYDGAIFQFDTNSTAQQYQPADTLQLPQGFTPAGFTFAADATRDLIAGDFNTGEVLQFSADGSSTTLVPGNTTPGAAICPLSMVALADGNLLIADSNPGGDAAGHHQILEYDAATGDVSQFIDLTAPVDTSGDPPQPTSLLLTPDGNLLVGLSPNEYYADGAVEEFDVATRQLISTVASSIGAPAGLALVPPSVMAVSASDWSGAGLTIAQTSDGMLNVYPTGSQPGTTTDVVPPQAADSVGEIQISGPDNAANRLTIDFSGGSPVPADGIFFDGVLGSGTNTVSIDDSAGSNAYSLTGSQLSVNGVPAVTMANTQSLDLDLGSGSFDLSGTNQTIGSISSTSFSIQSGTVGADLTGPGGLSKTGSGTATLSGSNNFLAGTTVTGGTLVLTTPDALPTGGSLTVGDSSRFTVAAAVPAPPALSSSNSVIDVLTPTSGSLSLAVSTVRTDAADTRLQGQVSASDSHKASASLPAWPVASSPAAQPSHAANDRFWKTYACGSDPAVARVPGAAGYLAWFGSSVPSSHGEDSTTQEERRIAALGAVLAQYGTP
jgi:autotransporter-associated beta strand protein